MSTGQATISSHFSIRLTTDRFRSARTQLAIAGMALLLAACATPQKFAASPAFLHEAANQKPKKVVILPPDIDVSEISAGGITEKDENWSKQAIANVEHSLKKVVSDTHSFRLVDLPKLPAADKTKVDKYLALYDVVGLDAFTFGRSKDPAWLHKSRNFDYTLGDGLHFLKQETGADAALFVVGSDQISSGGRKAEMVIGALFGVAVQPGITFVSVGLVDLDNGNILWLNYDYGGGDWDIRDPSDTDKLVANIFKDYPAAK